MSRKILDAAAAAAFCACLIIASNIPEKEVEVMQTSREENIKEIVFRRSSTAAGFHDELFGLSFTTESGEKTEIRKNEVILVTTPEEVTPVDESEEVVEAFVQTVMTTDVASNRWDITLTEEEIDLLARIVWLEANGEPVEGQEAVVEVVLNRMASDLYPNTLYDVLSQKNPVQFCSWKNRDYAEPTEKEYQSIRQVLNGNTSILRNDTLYFSTKPLTSNTDVRIGGHSFCY